MKTEFQVGDHIVSGRHFLRVFAYTHHGIYVGDGRVIHYEGNAQPRQTGPIKQVSLEEFAGGHSIRVKRHWKRMYDGRTSVARAWSRVGEDGYSVWGNNCEHFVEWCITGQHASPQAEALAHTAPVPASVTITWAGIGVVSVGGPIAGLSASGTMSGLATVGGLYQFPWLSTDWPNRAFRLR